MGTVTAQVREQITVSEAVTAYLATLAGPGEGRHAPGVQRHAPRLPGRVRRGHRAVRAGTTGRRGLVHREVGRLGTVDVERGPHRPPVGRGLLARPGWLAADLTGLLRARKPRPDRSRALARADVEALLTRDGIPLRERTLWRLLYESAARASEVLGLDVADLDLANRRARVIRKGSAVDTITWRTPSAHLLPRLLRGRTAGPVFLTSRRARVALPPGDIDPASGRARLGYRQASALFAEATAGMPGGPWNLHQLRHSALTHAAEDGASTATLLSYSGHTSVASLARYAQVSAEALSNWQAQRDPARRR
jgi:integrase